jgi:hypothetical protein
MPLNVCGWLFNGCRISYQTRGSQPHAVDAQVGESVVGSVSVLKGIQQHPWSLTLGAKSSPSLVVTTRMALDIAT